MDDDTKICPRCAETVRAQAQACRFCGYDFAAGVAGTNFAPKAVNEPKPSGGCLKAAAFTALAFVALIIVLAMIGSQKPNPALTGTDSSAPDSESASGSYSMKRITAEEYAQLYDGMSYSQAVAVIGEPGEETSRTDMAGYVTVAYSWKNYDGSNAIIMFQNNKLVSKAQFGL